MENRITHEPRRMGVWACIRETRITVAAIVRRVASRMRIDENLEAYPQFEAEDVAASLRYAAARAEERVIPFGWTGS